MQEVVGCEFSVSRGNMFLVIRCCLLLCFACVGCSGSKSIEPAPPSELTASAEERKEPLPVTEPQPLDPFDVPKLSDLDNCLLYTSPSPRDRTRSRMPSSA